MLCRSQKKALLFRTIKKFQVGRKRHGEDEKGTLSFPHQRQPHVKVAQNQIQARRAKYKWRTQTGSQSHIKVKHQKSKVQIKKGRDGLWM